MSLIKYQFTWKEVLESTTTESTRFGRENNDMCFHRAVGREMRVRRGRRRERVNRKNIFPDIIESSHLHCGIVHLR